MPTKKWLAPTLLAAVVLSGSASAQQYTTGQAARLVIGQKPFGAAEPGASDVLLGALNGVAYGGDTLVVADSNRVGAEPNNNRVLIYRDLANQVLGRLDLFPQNDTRCPACIGKATSVLGQADFTKVESPRAVAQSTMNRPLGVAYNGRILAVADTDNNRVLIWNSIPTSNQRTLSRFAVEPAPVTVVMGMFRLWVTVVVPEAAVRVNSTQLPRTSETFCPTSFPRESTLMGTPKLIWAVSRR